MKVKRIIFNWAYTSDIGIEYHEHEVGKEGVVKITENPARGEGDKWQYYVEFKNGQAERVFNVANVYFEKDDSIF